MIRMSRRGEHPIAFVEFADIPSATTALKALRGAPVGSSRIRVEYAHRKMAPSPSQTDSSVDEGTYAETGVATPKI